MNMSKGVEHKQSRFLKNNVWIFLLALLVSSNYTGHCASLKNASDLVTSEQTNEENSPFQKATDAITPPSTVKGPKFSMAKKIFSLALILNHVVIVILSLLLLGFFNSQPIVKQSILLNLYKDFTFVLMILNCSWVITLVQYSSGNAYEMSDPLAIIMSFLIYFLKLQVLLHFNLISVLNLYMVKKAMINPPMPWGDNEDLGTKIIRLAAIVPVFVFTTTMYVFGIYPKVYFTLKKGYKTSLTDVPKETIIFFVPIAFLLITFLITSLVAFHFKKTRQQNLDTGIPQLIYHLGLLSVALIPANLLFSAFGVSWEIYHLIFSLLIIVIQLVIILKNEQLTSYVKSYLSFDILHLNVRFVCMCLCIYVFVGLCVN